MDIATCTKHGNSYHFSVTYYSSSNRAYTIQATVAVIVLLAVALLAPSVGTNAKVFAVVLLPPMFWFFYRLMSKGIRVIIDDSGIEIGERYIGPFRAISEFSGYIPWSLKPTLRFEWSQIQSISFARWQRWWNLIPLPIHYSGGSTYLVIELAAGGSYAALILGSPWASGYRFTDRVMAGLQQAGHSDLVKSQVYTV